MAKAGRNLRFLRSGLTMGQHVAVAGEVIPLPQDFAHMSKQEQLDYYGVVHYQLTNDPVNTGPTATVAFKRIPEPEDVRTKPPFAEAPPALSTIERAGGGGSTQIPPDALPVPDPTTVPGYESKSARTEFKREEEEQIKVVERDNKTFHKERARGADNGHETIVLHRLPTKRKKKLVAAKPTRMERKKVS